MKKFSFIPLGLAVLTANLAFAADEIHYTITGKNSVTFNWRGSATENSIGLGLSPGIYTQVKAQTPKPLPVSSKGPFWEAKLTGLKANTLYYYSIGNTPERTFRTAPIPGSSGFTVYTQGDIGDTTDLFNVGVVQDIIATDKPAFVIGLGNLSLGSTYGKAAVDQHFNDVMAWSKDAAYMPIWGNQDWVLSLKDNFKNYKGRFDLPNPQASPGSPLTGGEDWYWFDYGNTRFIALPEPWAGAWSDWNVKADALMSQAQADSNIKFIVTMVHQPAYSSGHFIGSPVLKDMLDALGDRYNKYVLNLNSHSRNYERSHPQHGVVHVTAGIGGSNFQQDGTCLWLTCAKPTWSAFRAMHHGALQLKFTASDIKGSFICGPSGGGTNDVACTKGSVVDSFTIAVPSAVVPTANKAAAAVASSSPMLAQAAPISTTACTQTPIDVSGSKNVGGFAYQIRKSFGTSADNNNLKTQSTLRLFENGLEMGPAHSFYDNIANTGQGRFVHWGQTDGTGEALYFSALNNTDPRTNGKSYTYCLNSNSTTADTQAPSVPANLKATAASSSQINLSWSAATDNVGISGYKIYRNSSQIGTTSATSFSNSGLTASTSYTYTVAAYDAAGNTSGNSTAATTSTGTTTTITNPTTASCAPAPTSSLVVNVKDKGATGNGVTNDTAAIQAAVDQVAGTGGTVLVPDGTYMIDAVTHLYLRSNMTLRMTSGAVLKAIPNNKENYGVVKINSASNVNVIGGTVQGERTQHQGTTGQWGHGIEIYGSNKVVIEGVISKDNWGDGFYISSVTKDSTFCSLTADNNRRTGLVITSGDGLVIKDSVFKNTNKGGTLPMAGINIEPNKGETVNNVQILRSQFLNNTGSGITSQVPDANAGVAFTTNVTIDGNTVSNNGVTGLYSAGIMISKQPGGRIMNNIVKNNVQDGIVLTSGSKNNTVSGNTITGNGNNVDSHIGIGILLYDDSTNNTVTNNTVTGNLRNINNAAGSNTISNNIVN
jgi:parallel beta-helix repeat protein